MVTVDRGIVSSDAGTAQRLLPEVHEPSRYQIRQEVNLLLEQSFGASPGRLSDDSISMAAHVLRNPNRPVTTKMSRNRYK